MTNEKINATVEEIMEYEALLDEVKGIVDGLKDNLKMRWQREKWKAFPQTAIQSDGQRFLLPSLILRNLKRFMRIFTPLFFVRLVQDVFQSVRNEIFFSLGLENEPREESS